MNEYTKSQLLKINDNLYFLPHSNNWYFYDEEKGDFERADLTSDKKSVDLKLQNKLLRKYKQRIREEYYRKYGN